MSQSLRIVTSYVAPKKAMLTRRSFLLSFIPITEEMLSGFWNMTLFSAFFCAIVIAFFGGNAPADRALLTGPSKPVLSRPSVHMTKNVPNHIITTEPTSATVQSSIMSVLSYPFDDAVHAVPGANTSSELQASLKDSAVKQLLFSLRSFFTGLKNSLRKVFPFLFKKG